MASALYPDPSAATWLDCLRKIIAGAHGVPGKKVLRGDPLFLLAPLRPNAELDFATLSYEASRAGEAASRIPSADS